MPIKATARIIVMKIGFVELAAMSRDVEPVKILSWSCGPLTSEVSATETHDRMWNAPSPEMWGRVGEVGCLLLFWNELGRQGKRRRLRRMEE